MLKPHALKWGSDNGFAEMVWPAVAAVLGIYLLFWGFFGLFQKGQSSVYRVYAILYTPSGFQVGT